MYTPCLHLTSSDEYVHAVRQYMELFASTPKSGGRGRRKGICAVIVSPSMEVESEIFTQVKNPTAKTNWQGNMFS